MSEAALSHHQRAVLDRIDPGEVLELASALIRIPSITGQEGRQISDFLHGWLSRLGLAAGLQQSSVPAPESIVSLTAVGSRPAQLQPTERYNVVADLPGKGRPAPGKSALSLLFQGHLDTKWVDGMEIDPFGAEVHDGKLYGRGAADMKSGLAAMLVAMKALKESGIPLAGTCRFASEVGEEGGGWGLTELDQAGYLRADAAVIAEPSSLEVQIGNRGTYKAEIQTTGRAIHNGLAQEGVNAIEKMAPVIAGLYSLPLRQYRDPVWGTTSISIQKIDGGGRWEASVADECRLWVDFRVTPHDPPEEVDRQVRGMLEGLAQADPELQYDLRQYAGSPAVAISANESLVAVASRAVEQIRGSARLGACPGGTAAGYLIQRHATPAIILGPGSLAQAHGRTEWVEVQQVIDAARIYALIAVGLLADTN